MIGFVYHHNQFVLWYFAVALTAIKPFQTKPLIISSQFNSRSPIEREEQGQVQHEGVADHEIEKGEQEAGGSCGPPEKYARYLSGLGQML